MAHPRRRSVAAGISDRVSHTSSSSSDSSSSSSSEESPASSDDDDEEQLCQSPQSVQPSIDADFELSQCQIQPAVTDSARWRRSLTVEVHSQQPGSTGSMSSPKLRLRLSGDQPACVE